MDFSKKELKSLVVRFGKFLNSFVIFLLYFGAWVGGAIWAGILLIDGLDLLGVSRNISVAIVRIILTIVPLFPTLFIWNKRDKGTRSDDIEGAVMDCCFMAWIVIIIVAWSL